MLLRLLLLALCVVALPRVGTAQSESTAPGAEPSMVERVHGGDHFVAGRSVHVLQPIAGDLVAAGGNVDVDAAVSGDAVLAGGTVRVTGSIGNSLYVGGGQVTIDGAVGRSARIGGGRVEIGPKADITGGVSAAGGEIRIDGTVHGYVQAAGGRVLINGTVGGDVSATAGTVELGPNARIAGKLRYASRDEIRSDPAAQVAGGVERTAMAGSGAAMRTSYGSRWVRGLVWTAGLMLLAAILVAALPAFTARVASTLRTRLGMSLLMGFVALVCTPVAIVILLVTLIGIPMALLTLVLYFALLIAGYMMTSIGVGDWALGRYRTADAARTGWRIGAAVVAVLVIALLARIPFVGGLLTFAVLLAGVGAVVMQARAMGTAGTTPA